MECFHEFHNFSKKYFSIQSLIYQNLCSIAATHDIKQALYCPEAKFGEITFPRSAACSKVALPCSIYNDTDGSLRIF